MQVNPAISGDGRLVYVNMTVTMNLWSIALDANNGKVSGQPEPVTTGQMGKWGPFVSGDGSRLAYTAFAGLKSARIETRVRDLATGAETAIPAHGSPTPARPKADFLLDTSPVLNVDGSLLAHRDTTPRGVGTYVVRRGEAAGRLVCDMCRLHAFSSDSSFAIVQVQKQLVRQNLASGVRTPLLDVPAGAVEQVALSPDDSSIAFAIGQPDGKMVIYTAPVGERAIPRSEWTMIAEDHRYLASPAWSPDGKLLYYLSQRGDACAVWAQHLDAAGRRPIGAPFEVYRHAGPHQSMAVPKSNGAICIAPNRMIFYVAEASGNLFTAKVDVK